MTILGIDPSLYGTGWALLDCSPAGCSVVESGTIKIKRRPTLKGRVKRHNVAELTLLHHELTLLIRRATRLCNVSSFALEVPINLPGHQTAVLWQVQGLIRGILGASGLTGGCYDPGEVKAAVTGSRKAEKDVVERFVQAQISKPYKFGGNDESDAAAVAITHWLKKTSEAKQEHPRKHPRKHLRKQTPTNNESNA
ncbi:MAG: crossover junction endodeoxyribonuclease RuvC [Verrucomicrobia bacterium]|nr:crossover junction endodeoxyribonuclease RuvC [Verrucomicrobiota bacterium]